MCFECDSKGETHDHHVVPASRGGKRTVPLCLLCHGLVHDKTMTTSVLTSRALARLRRKGVRISRRIPLGYDLAASDATRLIPNDREQKLIRLIQRRRKEHCSYAAIAAEMISIGAQTKCGGRWHPSTIKAILSRLAK